LIHKEGETLKPSKMSPEEYDARFTACKPFRNQILDLLDDGSVLVALSKFAIHALFDDRNKKASTVPEFLEFEGKTYMDYCVYHPAYLLYRPLVHDKLGELLEVTNAFKIVNGGNSDD
jgi:uracil-DNA glycosylase